MNASQLEQVLAGFPIGPIRFFESIGSTNDEAARWIQTGAPNLALVVANEQTAGRGRAGRKWFTPPGAALALSLVLKPPFQAQYPQDTQSLTARLTGLGALAVCQALNRDYNLTPQIKWPNDVLLDGRKAAGILVEAHWQGDSLVSAVLGVGVNVSVEAVPSMQSEWIFPATCVQTFLEDPVSRPMLLRSILVQLLEWYKQIDNSDFLKAWQNNLAYQGKWVQIISPNGAKKIIQEGQVIGLDGSGRLKLLDTDGNIAQVHSGEIQLRPV